MRYNIALLPEIVHWTTERDFAITNPKVAGVNYLKK